MTADDEAFSDLKASLEWALTLVGRTTRQHLNSATGLQVTKP
jgi:hypothetical protein